jgi:cytoskeletal protein CcmA (bactofilin family)
MFGSKEGKTAAKTKTIDSLIGVGTVLEGRITFKGGLRIDGVVNGDVLADQSGDTPNMLVLSEQGRINGAVRGTHLVINGQINGPVQADEQIELQPKSRVTGDIRYKTLEIHHGAVVEGALSHLDGARQALKLAASND